MLVKTSLKKRAKAPKTLSLREFHQKRNEVLIIRNRRGLGDILMSRMMFEDFHRVMPDIKLVFACPSEYHDIVKTHPFVHEVKDSEKINKSDYLMSYDITDVDIRWESFNAPNSGKHRADIWAEHCGVKLIKHDMHVPIVPEKYMKEAERWMVEIKQFCSNKPVVLFCPKAYDKLRSLQDHQMEEVFKYMRDKGLYVIASNNEPIPALENLGCPVLCQMNKWEWLSLIHNVDYVVTVDTSSFHYAGAIKKPMVGIFTHVDGKYRGKYFDFILVQKHRDNGDWPCGPCYDYSKCSHPNCTGRDYFTAKPCVTELSAEEIIEGVEKMLLKWPLVK